jgi:DNA-binding FrmR family transcriptional regulator
MSSGYDSSEDENIRLEHGLSATIDRITRLQRRSKRVVSTLQSIKISLDSAIERCLSDIRVQVDYVSASILKAATNLLTHGHRKILDT